MRYPARIVRQGLLMLVIALGLMGFAMNPAAARELCSENGTLELADGNGDGVVSRGEIQSVIDLAGDAEGAGQLQSLLNGLPGDVTGIRYVNCTASEDGGTGTGDGDTGTDGDGGSGTGTDTGDGGSGTGTGDGGAGTGTGDGGSGTGDGGSDSGAASQVTINAQGIAVNPEGTPVNAITGLPDTGQGSGSGVESSGTVVVWLVLAIAGVVAVAGTVSLRMRSQGR